MRRLALQLPTILQIDIASAVLFHKKGVRELSSIHQIVPYALLGLPKPSRIWALVDSNSGLFQPTGAFTDWSPFFVVQTASPHKRRTGWHHKANSEYFYMKRWTFSEVLQA